MVTTATVLTLSLAKVIGLYMLAAGLGGLLDSRRWARVLEQLKGDDALVYISGVFVFALGAAIVLAHNIWTDPLAVIVTIIGYAAAIEGIILLVRPNVLLGLGVSLVRPAPVQVFSIIAMIAGAALLFAGLTGRAGAV